MWIVWLLISQMILKTASQEFSIQAGLDVDWLNNGPESLGNDLPDGWRDRVQPLFNGHAISLTTLGRIDLLRSKLFAYCDRQQDLSDCVALKPSTDELNEIHPWLSECDANPRWAEHVQTSLRFLKKELGYDT